MSHIVTGGQAPCHLKRVRKCENKMDTRTAIIAIIVKSTESAENINQLLHEYREYIIGRMGIPYHKKNVNIISIAIDAPQDKINSLAGRIGRIEGVTTKTVYAPED